MNQCDGCRRGLSLRHGIHIDGRSHAVQMCTAYLYVDIAGKPVPPGTADSYDPNATSEYPSPHKSPVS